MTDKNQATVGEIVVVKDEPATDNVKEKQDMPAEVSAEALDKRRKKFRKKITTKLEKNEDKINGLDAKVFELSNRNIDENDELYYSKVIKNYHDISLAFYGLIYSVAGEKNKEQEEGFEKFLEETDADTFGKLIEDRYLANVKK